MRATSIRQKAKAFTLVESLVIVALVAVIAVLLLPAQGGSRRSSRIMCAQNLKQVGMAINVFAVDHNDQFPMQISVTNGGSMEFVGTGSPALHFQTVSNYLSDNWGLLLCPADDSKQRASNHAVISDRNISYFLGMDATYGSPSIILDGDRNLGTPVRPVKPGLFSLTTNATVSWTREMHGKGATVMGGNVLFADGHVEWSARNLPEVIQRQNVATNRLAFP